MTDIVARKALLAGGWCDNVRIRTAGGVIADIESGIETGREPEAGGVLCDVVIPGLCNAHSHAFQRALAGHTERPGADAADTFWTWRKLMYALAGKLDPPALTDIARQAYAEMVASGYTSVVEFHYLHGSPAERRGAHAMLDALLVAAHDAGIRLCYVPVLYERADFDAGPLSVEQQRFVMSLDEFLAHYAEAAAALPEPHTIGIGAHSLRAVSRASLEVIASQTDADAVPLHLHVAEQQGEVDGCLAAYGARPVRWLLDNFDVGDRWSVVHATHMDDDEVAMLAESGAVTVLCPTTEANLGDGFFRLGDYLDAGGRIAIGSDSQVSIDPFEELRWLEYGQRLLVRQRNVASRADAGTGHGLYLRAADGGARAAGSGSGHLEEGAAADLVALDGDGPMLVGHDASLLDALVFTGLPVPIRRVMVHGVWQVTDGTHVNAGPAAGAYAATVRRLALAGST